MSESALHPTPSTREVLLAQIRAVGLALRWPAAVAAVALALATAIAVNELRTGVVIDFQPQQFLLFGAIGLLLPFAIWMREDRFGSGFLWTLPVDRRRHALVRVAAGWIWLMAAVMVLVLWLLALALASGENPLAAETLLLLPAEVRERMGTFPFPSPDALDPAVLEPTRWRPQPLLWLTPFTAATGAYLLASAVALGIRLRWLAAALLGLFLVGVVAEATDVEWLMHAPHNYLRPFLLGPWGLDALLTARTVFLKVGTTLSTGEAAVVWRGVPDVGQWAGATLLWLAAGLAAVHAAAFRHRERRRG